MGETGIPYPHYEWLLDHALLWFMTVLRLAGVFMLAPFYGSSLIPARARIVVVAAFAFALLPVSAQTADLPRPADGLVLILIAGQEFMLGLSLGFLSSIIFNAAQLAGELVGQQIGLSMANVLDPLTEQEVPLIGTLQTNIATLVFVLAKLDLTLIWIYVMGYRLIGIGQLAPRAFIGPTAEAAVIQVRSMYWLGLQLALPVMTVMLLASVVEGYVTRTMPQMNIMVFGIPLKLVIGFFALMLTVPGVARVMMPESTEFDPAAPPAGPFGELMFQLEDWVMAVAERLEPADGPPPEPEWADF